MGFVGQVGCGSFAGVIGVNVELRGDAMGCGAGSSIAV